MNSTVEDLLRKERISYKTLLRVVNYQVNKKVDWSEYSHIETIRIDEISYKKGVSRSLSNY